LFLLILFSPGGQQRLQHYIFFVKQAQYEPGSVDTFLRALFSVFSNHGITYRKDSHFNEKGDFQAYWKDTFAKTQAHREDYGTLPNASTFDDNFVIKRYEAIKKGVLRPLSDYDHHTYILLEDFLQKNMLRGSQEPVSITINDLEHGTMPAESGKRGMRFYRLKASHSGQKGNALSLKNTSTENPKNMNGCAPMVEDPDDPYCLYYLLHRHLTQYLPPDASDGRIFRRKASNKQIKVCSVHDGVDYLNDASRLPTVD
jgi:hypothetical protein